MNLGNTRSSWRFLAAGLVILAGILIAWPDAAVAKMAPVAQPGKRVIEQTPLLGSAPLSSVVDGVWNKSSDEAGIVRRLTRIVPVDSRRSGSTFDPDAVARAFLIDQRGGMSLKEGLSDLRLDDVIESPGGFHVRYQQVYQGVPIEAGVVWVTVSRGGQVSRAVNESAADLSLEVQPSVSAADAIRAVREAVGVEGGLHAPERADLVVRRYQGRTYLAWKTLVPADEPFGDWEAYVDAGTGRIVEIRDRVLNYVDGTGKVWDPNPVVALMNTALQDLADADQVLFAPAYQNAVLHELDAAIGGLYRLRGRFASSDEIESPAVTLATDANANNFLYTRADDRFEEVIVYYSIDATQRHIQGLGFTNINNRVQHFDAHGLAGADNSHYVPTTKIIAYGDGCVDDAEDADVIIHEYGHSIQDNQVPGWGASSEGGAMGEGFGDYLAGSMSVDVNPTFQPWQVFDWDKGPGEAPNCWAARRLDGTKHYPEDLVGEVHDDGEIWSAVLWEIANAIGFSTMDAIVFESQFDVPTTGTMVDGGEAIVTADQNLFGGVHVGTILYYMDARGILDASGYIPTIVHTPLGDTENTVGPYLVTAVITPGAAPLDPAQIFTVYRPNSASWTNLLMVPTANPNEYGASIPGQAGGTIIDYYVSAKDTSGGTSTHPVDAPASFHTFTVGPDAVPPLITHTPLADQPLLQWPARVRARVTDNLGVASVVVEWTRNAVPETGFTLAREGLTDYYSALFPVGAPPVAIGDLICYVIRATDSSSNANQALAPAIGSYCFDVTDVLGDVLVINDWDGAKSGEPKIIEGKDGVSSVESDSPSKVESASRIARWLREGGYAVDVQTSAASDPAGWPDYTFIVSSSGDDTGPVSSATYRSALESYVLAGHKLLIEGGEVGYDAASSPGYPTFLTNVLHITEWNSDGAGDLILGSGYSCHPLVTTPNALPSTLAISYGEYADEDANTPAADALVIYGTTSYPNSGGVHIYDDNTAPRSAQIVDFNFNIDAIADSTQAKALVLNAAGFLAANEGTASGSISGRVILVGAANNGGVLVTAGGQSGMTDLTGDYTVTGLYPGQYTVTATKAGYENGSASCTAVLEGQTTPDVNFTLNAIAEYCANPIITIPDNNTTGITSTITVSGGETILNALVSVNITHTWIGDLEVSLKSPSNTTVMLHNRTGVNADNIVTTYDSITAVDGPGTMSDFDGQSSNGAWSLKVRDLDVGATGTLNQWCLILSLHQTAGGGEAGILPSGTALYGARPNPFGPTTAIRYDLASSGRIVLALYDASGRLVRTLLDGLIPAGRYEAVWDGRGEGGARVAAGVYFARLQADGRMYGSKMVVLD